MVLGYFRLRKIIPSSLKTQLSKSPEEARQRAISLYRLCLRYSGEIQAIYPLDVPVYQIRRRIRQEFDKNRFVDQLSVRNALIMKGAMELEETLYMWKTQAHVMKYFQEVDEIRDEQRKKQWLSGFLEGRN